MLGQPQRVTKTDLMLEVVALSHGVKKGLVELELELLEAHYGLVGERLLHTMIELIRKRLIGRNIK